VTTVAFQAWLLITCTTLGFERQIFMMYMNKTVNTSSCCFDIYNVIFLEDINFLANLQMRDKIKSDIV